jgi:hypothetical protein
MADNPIREVEHLGLLGQPAPLILGKDQQVTPEAIVSINRTLAALVTHINRGLSVGTGQVGSRVGNFRNQWLVFLSPSTADLEFELPHGLGRTPIGFTTWFVDKAGVIYASRFGSWNKERVFLKVSTTSTNCAIELA